MEFIPLERYSKKIKYTQSSEKEKSLKNKKGPEDETSEDVIVKTKQRNKEFNKKNFKNKYKETMELKKKKRIPKKKMCRRQEDEDEEIGAEGEKEDGDVVNDGQENEEDEEQDYEESFKRKCQEMDDRKKNRLFVKLRKKILNQAQIKELHNDIKTVIFPRKKNSRWCWAVFASEEGADKAMKQLINNKEILVSKPTPYEKIDKKQKEKMKTILRKRDARKKLQKMWM